MHTNVYVCLYSYTQSVSSFSCAGFARAHIQKQHHDNLCNSSAYTCLQHFTHANECTQTCTSVSTRTHKAFILFLARASPAPIHKRNTTTTFATILLTPVYNSLSLLVHTKRSYFFFLRGLRPRLYTKATPRQPLQLLCLHLFTTVYSCSHECTQTCTSVSTHTHKAFILFLARASPALIHKRNTTTTFATLLLTSAYICSQRNTHTNKGTRMHTFVYIC